LYFGTLGFSFEWPIKEDCIFGLKKHIASEPKIQSSLIGAASTKELQRSKVELKTTYLFFHRYETFI